MAQTLVPEATVCYLHPFGSTQIKNIESINNSGTGPLIFCYDQEPLLAHYNRELFKHARYHIKDLNDQPRRVILLNTERTSQVKNQILDEFGFTDCSYFFHAFAAADWYRGYQYRADLTAPNKRHIQKKYITFNRLTGSARAYRSFLIAELAQHNLLDQGYVSYSDVCPEHGHYEHNITATIQERGIAAEYVAHTKQVLDTVAYPLRIDNTGPIPNGSFSLGAIPECMSSFLHVVTETCYWESKTHLTEKIFKPIVTRQPFVLLGCANNLQYLRSYGFKTFDAWWDEGYDKILDPIARLQAVVKIIHEISSMSNQDLEAMLVGMQYVLDYNHNLFYSKKFIDHCWTELSDNLQAAIAQLPPQT